MKRPIRFLSLLLLILFLSPAVRSSAKTTDEILNYIITVDVNQDATLTMNYHIDWKVLDDSIGALEWVQIGIPNNRYVSISPLTDNIRNVYVDSSGSEVFAKVYFDKKYYENEIVSFAFSLVQDYMYEMNVLTEGETVYYFTPGWFDGIPVDYIEINWSAENAIAWSHGATTSDNRLIWSGSLDPGHKFTEVSVTYPSDTYLFDASKTVNPDGSYSSNDGGYYSDYNDSDDSGSAFLGFIVLVVIIIGIGKVITEANNYSSGSGFTEKPATKKKITRTLIKYYPECPGCGAPRPENAEKCEYCGRSFIESEEVVEEKEIENPEKYADEGTFRYGSSPNTYVRVHVTHVPVPRSTSRSCVHSSCAHSSCACAHSCACACACACAGGGRAGCSTKDFYNTNLKLRQLSIRKLKKNRAD